MTDLLNWFTEHESALSGIAAMIAIIAGVAVATRLTWSRMPGKGISNLKRPAFLSDWRNIGLISLTTLALLLMAGLREKLELAALPDVVRGTALALILAGLLSMAFMGFAGLFSST